MSWRLIRPDPPTGGELPATEFIHALPLGALLLLAVNDHLLKGSGLLPGVITGKISDFAGLFFFPLLLTACLDVLLHGLNWLAGRSVVDASLRLSKLVGAGLFTALLFTSIKLSAEAAAIYAQALHAVDLLGLLPGISIVQDLSDLLALPAIGAAIWFGRSRIAEIPPARLAVVVERVRRGVKAEEALRQGLEDCRRASRRRDPAFDALVHGLTPWITARARGEAPARSLERASRALAAWRDRGHE